VNHLLLIHDLCFNNSTLNLVIKGDEKKEYLENNPCYIIFKQRNSNHEYKKEISFEKGIATCTIDMSCFSQHGFYFKSEEVIDVKVIINDQQFSLTSNLNFSTYHKFNEVLLIKPYITKIGSVAFYIKKKECEVYLEDIIVDEKYLKLSLNTSSFAELKAELKDVEKFLVLKKRKGPDVLIYNKNMDIPCIDKMESNNNSFSSEITAVIDTLSITPQDIIDAALKINMDSCEVEYPIQINDLKQQTFYNVKLKPYKNSKGNLSFYSDTGYPHLKKERNYKVSILGSCITRDNFNTKFNPEYKQNFEVISLQNQTSIISLMSKPLEYNVSKIDNNNEYDTRTIISDLDKSYLSDLKKNKPDILIVDLFGDVYFGCLRIKDSYVTNNHWKLTKTTYYKELNDPLKFNVIENEKEYLKLWKEAVDRLFTYFKNEIPNCKIILHKARFTKYYYDMSMQVRKFESKLNVDLLNSYWSKFDDYLTANYNIDYIDLTHKVYIAQEDHPWGLFNLHYENNYYRSFLDELKSMILY